MAPLTAAIRTMHDLGAQLQLAGISCMLIFAEGGKPEYPEKTSRSKVENQHKLSLHMTYIPGIEPGSHWWEASALITTPTLLPPSLNFLIHCRSRFFIRRAGFIGRTNTNATTTINNSKKLFWSGNFIHSIYSAIARSIKGRIFWDYSALANERIGGIIKVSRKIAFSERQWLFVAIRTGASCPAVWVRWGSHFRRLTIPYKPCTAVPVRIATSFLKTEYSWRKWPGNNSTQNSLAGRADHVPARRLSPYSVDHSMHSSTLKNITANFQGCPYNLK